MLLKKYSSKAQKSQRTRFQNNKTVEDSVKITVVSAPKYTIQVISKIMEYCLEIS